MPIFPRMVVALGLAAAAVAGMPAAGFAQLVSPFSADTARTPLDPEDQKLMMKAINDALEKYAVGVPTAWESPKTGRQGRAVLAKTYEMRGMRCAQVTHQFTKGPGTTYTAPMCKTEDGTWKFAH